MKVERRCFGRFLVAKFGGSSLADELKLDKATRGVELIRKSIKTMLHYEEQLGTGEKICVNSGSK